MRTLVIDTATAACSVALIEGDAVIDRRHEVVGRGHAERLVPMIAELDQQGRADRIWVDCGPGSFTGIRVGLAAAIGLGIGWRVPVSGYSSMAVIAAAAFMHHPPADALAVVIEGGHGELFMQHFRRGPEKMDELVSLRPAAVIERLGGRLAIGSGVRFLHEIAPELPGENALPDAADAVLLPVALTALAPRPIYGRAPDAVPPPPRGRA